MVIYADLFYIKSKGGGTIYVLIVAEKQIG
jgi:hypothetical protein